MSRSDQQHIQIAFIKVKEALDEIAQLRRRDYILANLQHTLYVLVDTLYQYIEPEKGRKHHE